MSNPGIGIIRIQCNGCNLSQCPPASFVANSALAPPIWHKGTKKIEICAWWCEISEVREVGFDRIDMAILKLPILGNDSYGGYII